MSPSAADNFFSLGGDSLRGTQVVSRINAKFDLHLPVTALFRYPTVQAMARHIEEALATQRAVSATLEAQIASMTDEEVARLLSTQSAPSP